MNSLDNISCTYILNLDSEKYKYDILKKKLDSFDLDLKIKRFSAIDGNLHKEEFHKSHEIYYNNLPKIKKKYYFQQNNIQNIRTDFNMNGNIFRSYGAYGCLLSYIKIFEDAIKNNYNNIFLLQDDIYFHKNFINLSNQGIKKYKNFGALYFGYSENIILKKKMYLGLFSVIINKKLFTKILNELKLLKYPADICVFNIVKSNKNYFLIDKKIIIPDITNSKTQNNNNNININKYYKDINFEDFDMSYNYYSSSLF